MGYTHGLSGGSGVLTGSSVDQINFSANHQLGRIWSGQVNLGYAHNAPIASVAQTNSQDFNTWTFGGGVNRAVGRNASFAVAYNLNLDKTNLPGCLGSECSSSQTIQYVTLNFQWHARPHVLP